MGVDKMSFHHLLRVSNKSRKPHLTEVKAAANAMSNEPNDSHPQASSASLALTSKKRDQQWAWLLFVLNWLNKQTSLQLPWSFSFTPPFVLLIAEVHILHSPRTKHSSRFIAQSLGCLHPA